MSEMQVFSLVRKTVPILMVGDDGKEVEYSIRELNGQERDKVLAEFTKSSNYDSKTGEVKITAIEGQMARLLSATLYDPDGKTVPFEVIQDLPATTIDALYAISAEMNGFAEKKKKDEDCEEESEDLGKK